MIYLTLDEEMGELKIDLSMNKKKQELGLL